MAVAQVGRATADAWNMWLCQRPTMKATSTDELRKEVKALYPGGVLEITAAEGGEFEGRVWAFEEECLDAVTCIELPKNWILVNTRWYVSEP